MSIVSTFKKFLSKHAKDLHSAASVLGTVVAASGIGGEDKDAAIEAIGTLVKSAENIAKSVSTIKDTADGVTHADVKKAVDNVKDAAVSAASAALPALVADLVAKEIAKLAPKA